MNVENPITNPILKRFLLEEIIGTEFEIRLLRHRMIKEVNTVNLSAADCVQALDKIIAADDALRDAIENMEKAKRMIYALADNTTQPREF